MSKPRKGKAQLLTYQAAVSELPAAEAAMLAESSIYQSAYGECVATLGRLYSVMARERARLIDARRRRDALRAIVDKGEGRLSPVDEFRENPHITQGLLDAVATGEVETQHEPMLEVKVSLQILVGGLSRMGWRTHAHVLAAAKFCNLHERSQIGGARATDYSQVRVDTSGPRQDQITASQDDARREYDEARKVLGVRARTVEEVVVYGVSGRGLAKAMGLGDSGRARRRAEAELKLALDDLARHWGYADTIVRQRRWSDGSAAQIQRHADGNILGGPPLAPVV